MHYYDHCNGTREIYVAAAMAMAQLCVGENIPHGSFCLPKLDKVVQNHLTQMVYSDFLSSWCLDLLHALTLFAVDN